MKPINRGNAVVGIQKCLYGRFGGFYERVPFGKHFFLRPIRSTFLDDKYRDSFYVLFKQEFFKSFNEQFPEFVSVNPEYAGVGESINLDRLRYVVNDLGVDVLLFVYPSDRVYSVYAKFLFRFVEKWGLIRSQDKFNDTSDSLLKVVETTACFPVKLLDRWGDL